MAEELVDEVCVDFENAEPCSTTSIGLLGRDGWEPTLSVQLVQHGGVRAEFRLDPGGKNRTQRNTSGAFLG